MSLSKYHYNADTCRYEPTQISIIRVTGIAILFFFSTALIFWGILNLHSKFFMTEKGKALKRENIALTKHHASLQNNLSSVKLTLVNLQEQNSDLHKKIFETPMAVTPSFSPKNSNILLADASGFHSATDALREKASTLSKAISDNSLTSVSVGKKELEFLMSIPSIQPIENEELTKLVSGFGKRVNPFHKGNYLHSGADFAATRGTSVMATASGIVVDLKKGSSLQAGYGNYVEIDHGNGLVTRYAHLENVTVRYGQKIKKGAEIGTVGMSGGAIAPHVHYEIIRKGDQVDPVLYMMENLNSKQYIELQKLGAKRNQSLD